MTALKLKYGGVYYTNALTGLYDDIMQKMGHWALIDVPLEFFAIATPISRAENL